MAQLKLQSRVVGGTKTAATVKAAAQVASAKRRRATRVETYNSYIYKVLKQTKPGTNISKKAMGIMNSFVTDIFERIATEAGHVVRRTNVATLSARCIQTAVRLVIPGDLGKHAVSEGTRAMPHPCNCGSMARSMHAGTSHSHNG